METEAYPEAELSAHELQCVRDDRILFDRLGFHLKSGEIMQVEGHNGSGKTSLLRILCGLALPAEGEVRWNAADIHADGGEFRSTLQYLGHNHGVKGELTPLENLNVARALSTDPNPLSLADALHQVGLFGFEDVPARALSAGQRRRVALARLRISRAQVWILDEPFTALDKRGVAYVEKLMENHAELGGIVVFTSHHPVTYSHVRHIRLGAV